MSERITRFFLLAVSIVNALSALVCGVLLVVAPDGSLMAAGELIPVVATLPLAQIFFQDLLWIGIAMLLVLCIPNATASILLMRRAMSQYQAAIFANALIMMWCTFQFFYMFNWLAVFYFVLAAAMVGCATLMTRKRA